MTEPQISGNHGEAPASAPVEVVRSEEQLSVSLPVRVRSGLRISKVIVTETVTQTVEVRREELRVEELETDDLTLTATNDGSDYDFADQEFDVVLHEERVILSTEVVPVERVRVRTRVVTDNIEISDTVRREQVEVDMSDGSAPASG